MSKKSHGKQRTDADGLRQRVERELAKGNAKGAVKEAIQCHRQESSPESKTLLERTYLARIEQLARLKQHGDARSLLERLDELGASTAEVVAQLPRLRVLIGDRRIDSATVCALDPSLAVELVDRAMLDASASSPVLPALAAQVQAVRAALAAIERGEDEAAAECLRQVPRDSPLSDWKLLARGLSAFYQRDRQRTEENWQRLDASRPAYRIAQTLLVAGGDLPREQGAAYAAGVRRLEAALQSSPAADVLQKLAGCWRDNDWHRFFEVYRAFRQRYAAAEGPLLEKIVELALHRILRERRPQLLERLTQIGPAQAQDPKWNRARAMMEESLDRFDVTPLERYWLAYAEDVAKLPQMRADEKSIAGGLIMARLARQFVQFGDESRAPATRMLGRRDDEEWQRFWRRAEELFEESLRRCPDLDDAYRDLARLHVARDDEEAAAAVWRRFAARRPDDFDAQLWLADYHLGRDEPADSQPYVEAACRLRPRDSRTKRLGWNQRITRIRCLAKKRKFDEARTEWQRAVDDAAAGGRMPIPPYTLDTMRAGIEFKAKQPEVGQRFVDAAVARVGEPTVVWLQMSSIAARYGLPRELKKDFDARYAEAIRQKPASATLGGVAELLCTLRANHVSYTGRATQERLLIKQLGRARRITWREDDLIHVCLLLSAVPRQSAQQKVLVEEGLRAFPDCAFFHVSRGGLEMLRGPWDCRRFLAAKHFRRALELLGRADSLSAAAEAGPAEPPRRSSVSSVLRDGLIEQAQQGLALLGDKGDPLEAFAHEFAFGRDDDVDDDELDDYDEEELDDDGSFRFSGPRRGARGGRSRGSASRGMPLFGPDSESDDLDDDDFAGSDAEQDDEGLGAGLPPGIPREIALRLMAQALLRTMPASLKGEITAAAKSAGISTLEVVTMALADETSPLGRRFAKLLGAEKMS